MKCFGIFVCVPKEGLEYESRESFFVWCFLQREDRINKGCCGESREVKGNIGVSAQANHFCERAFPCSDVTQTMTLTVPNNPIAHGTVHAGRDPHILATDTSHLQRGGKLAALI